MAGRFLSLEEAAQTLGVSVDDVQRLVDRKKLYPIRDGSGLKFKADDLDQYLRDQEEEAGTGDDLVAQYEVTSGLDAVPLELDPDPEDSHTLDVEAVLELEPASVIEAEPASVVTMEEPLSAIELADEPAAPAEAEPESLVLLEADDAAGSDVIVLADEADQGGDAANVISGLSAPAIGVGDAEASGGEVLLADSGRLSLDRDDLELESIIAASAPSLPVADEPAEEGTLSIDLGEPILGDPLASGGLESPAASLVVGSDADLVVGSNAASGKVGSALSDVLDSGVLIEEKAVELEGIQTWDEVDLGIEEEEQENAGLGDDAEAFSLGEGGELNDENFNLGDSDHSASINISADASEASDLFPSGIDSSVGLSGQSFGGGIGMSGSLDLPGDMVADVRFSTWQICGLVCCSLILLTGGIVAFDLVRTIGSPQGTALANPLLDALAETFGWR
jgi:excisionase family DNA binding protein